MMSITQKQIDDFKKLYPASPKIQALTLADVLANTGGKTVVMSTTALVALGAQ